MKKLLLLTLLIILSLSCENKNEIKLSNKLKNKNFEIDSLKRIIDTLKTKFIYDGFHIINVVNENQPIQAGENYTGKIYLIAYNYEDEILFSSNSNFTNAETLKREKDGGYLYKFNGEKGENNFHFKYILNDSLAKEFNNSILSNLHFSDSRNSE